MNEHHLRMLAGPEWARLLETDLLPWLGEVADLGDDVLEVGPGPGLTTDLLSVRTERLTAVEVDPMLAGRLAERTAGTNVEVIHRSAADAGLAAGRFSAAACFAVLHHVPSAGEQDRILRELWRVLRPGAVLVASDAYDDERTRRGHVDDVFVPLDPDALPGRLQALGFVDVGLERAEYYFRFHARRPVA